MQNARKRTDAMRAAEKRYKQRSVRRVSIDLYPPDQDILDYLEASGLPMATCFKQAMREYIERNS